LSVVIRASPFLKMVFVVCPVRTYTHEP
jgi:hypothetical protein